MPSVFWLTPTRRAYVYRIRSSIAATWYLRCCEWSAPLPIFFREFGADYIKYSTKTPETEAAPVWRASEPIAISLASAQAALQSLVDQGAHRLDAQSDQEGDRPLKRKPWSRKQALGHLIDWASAHQQWFARALTEPKLAAAGYPADEWVSAQQYAAFPWPDLVDLWVCLNRLLIHLLSGIPEEKLNTPCHIGVAEPVSLAILIGRYVEHCEDILGQILMHG